MDTVPLGRENEECCEEGVCSPRLFHVLCVPLSMHYMHCMSVGLVGRRRARVFGGRVAVHSIGMYVYCICVCHTMHV